MQKKRTKNKQSNNKKNPVNNAYFYAPPLTSWT